MRRGELRWAEHPDTVAKGHLRELIATLQPPKLHEVCRALSTATGC